MTLSAPKWRLSYGYGWQFCNTPSLDEGTVDVQTMLLGKARVWGAGVHLAVSARVLGAVVMMLYFAFSVPSITTSCPRGMASVTSERPSKKDTVGQQGTGGTQVQSVHTASKYVDLQLPASKKPEPFNASGVSHQSFLRHIDQLVMQERRSAFRGRQAKRFNCS